MEGRNDAEGTKKVGAGDRSRTYTGVSPEDFESSASAIPPLRHVNILGQDSLVSNLISANRKIGARDGQDQRRTTCAAETFSTGGRVEKNFTAFLPMVLVVRLFHTAPINMETPGTTPFTNDRRKSL
jgi:hypothetical protein